MTSIRRTAAVVGAIVLIGVLAVPVSAYTGEVPANITVTGPVAALACGKPVSLTATVDGASGTGVPGVTVSWSETSAPSGAHDKLATGTSTTDGTGAATNSITLSCIAGKRTITVTAQGGVLGIISLNLTPAGLPNTSTLPDGGNGSSYPVGLLLLVVLAAGFGAVFAARRVRS